MIGGWCYRIDKGRFYPHDGLCLSPLSAYEEEHRVVDVSTLDMAVLKGRVRSDGATQAGLWMYQEEVVVSGSAAPAGKSYIVAS